MEKKGGREQWGDEENGKKREMKEKGGQDKEKE